MTTILTLIVCAVLQVIPSGAPTLTAQRQKDSILVADPVEYAIELEHVRKGTEIELADLKGIIDPSIEVVGSWKESVLGTEVGQGEEFDNIRFSITLQPFDEKAFELPELPVVCHNPDGTIDTLIFQSCVLEVKSIPIDTSSFVVHDIKRQDVLETTFSDIVEDSVPWLLGVVALAVLVLLVLLVVRIVSRRSSSVKKPEVPAHVAALAALDAYRSEEYWKPENQKQFYSGITDTLREYISKRFRIDAMEMTTSEVFDALKGNPGVPEDVFAQTRSLFELADFVKFAKMTAGEQDNASALPSAVRFVNEAYQSELGETAKPETREDE